MSDDFDTDDDWLTPWSPMDPYWRQWFGIDEPAPLIPDDARTIEDAARIVAAERAGIDQSKQAVDAHLAWHHNTD